MPGLQSEVLGQLGMARFEQGVVKGEGAVLAVVERLDLRQSGSWARMSAPAQQSAAIHCCVSSGTICAFISFQSKAVSFQSMAMRFAGAPVRRCLRRRIR
jgi:hypothetical protein